MKSLQLFIDCCLAMDCQLLHIIRWGGRGAVHEELAAVHRLMPSHGLPAAAYYRVRGGGELFMTSLQFMKKLI